jgi:iron complex transport system substrate-binding protein
VVSINLCTDQLALVLAEPGQLVSVSRFAKDPATSVMVDSARDLPTNGSGAEEVYLLRPDLVLASSYTDPATLSLLQDLGVAVEVFAPAQSLSDIPDRLRQMGKALGQEAAAEIAIEQFETELANLTVTLVPRPRAAIYYVNSFTSGTRSLASDILRVAGFDNVAPELAMDWGGVLPLEQLVMLAPDVIIRGRDYPGQARAEDNLNHPALAALAGTAQAGHMESASWVCGTPHVLDAVRDMRDLRMSLKAAK